jgi:hypothetical protein
LLIHAKLAPLKRIKNVITKSMTTTPTTKIGEKKQTNKQNYNINVLAWGYMVLDIFQSFLLQFIDLTKEKLLHFSRFCRESE